MGTANKHRETRAHERQSLNFLKLKNVFAYISGFKTVSAQQVFSFKNNHHQNATKIHVTQYCNLNMFQPLWVIFRNISSFIYNASYLRFYNIFLNIKHTAFYQSKMNLKYSLHILIKQFDFIKILTGTSTKIIMNKVLIFETNQSQNYLTTQRLKMTLFWDVVLCSLTEVY
jgi:hypothetical protein